ncbi:L,D-transpeptidase [Periweissella fabaria]|uniref:L,D-TPase catalytic domain-containing protein n=1 Tax=Periweissella fabaria TaxID=546157 RepID=A0ABM8Z6D1_9LACO|nr:L,D-transpeptidase [Periweissella fabaria]CAH0416883.1 hypothetical protein WFA24289_01196 [Periweissella fabaria]
MSIKKFLPVFAVLTLLVAGGFAVNKALHSDEALASKTTPTKAGTINKPTASTQTTPTKATPTNMRQPINWRLSSETIPYPNVAQHPDMWIHVSLEKQRVYLMDGTNVLYTMYASTGEVAKGWGTPKGTYHIQAERGHYFYAPNVNEGAYNWVSFLDHGVYLFHSVPFDKAGHVIPEAAKAQGTAESSHGCVHLTMADSEWFVQNIKYNTKVVID